MNIPGLVSLSWIKGKFSDIFVTSCVVPATDVGTRLAAPSKYMLTLHNCGFISGMTHNQWHSPRQVKPPLFFTCASMNRALHRNTTAVVWTTRDKPLLWSGPNTCWGRGVFPQSTVTTYALQALTRGDKIVKLALLQAAISLGVFAAYLCSYYLPVKTHGEITSIFLGL